MFYYMSFLGEITRYHAAMDALTLRSAIEMLKRDMEAFEQGRIASEVTDGVDCLSVFRKAIDSLTDAEKALDLTIRAKVGD